MPDPSDLDREPLPMRYTLGNILIYFTPLLWFGWLGPFWKFASVISVGIGVWRCSGFLRRAFGVVYLVMVLVYGYHARTGDDDWPFPGWLMAWLVFCFMTHSHADGAKAEADAARPRKEWD